MSNFGIDTTAPVLTISPDGAKGPKGDSGADGVGFEDVQFEAFCRNKYNVLVHFGGTGLYG